MRFPILYIEYSVLDATFNPPGQGKNIKKIVFQFHFNDEGENNRPTLVGYTAKQNGVFTPKTSVITLLKSTAEDARELDNPLNLGSLEFTRTDFENLQNIQNYLVFVPIKSTLIPNSNSVTYKTAWSESLAFPSNIIALAVGDELNPSPPKTPGL